jgi:hypothetical protein
METIKIGEVTALSAYAILEDFVENDEMDIIEIDTALAGWGEIPITVLKDNQEITIQANWNGDDALSICLNRGEAISLANLLLEAATK